MQKIIFSFIIFVAFLDSHFFLFAEKIKEMKRIEQFLKSKKEAIFNAHLASRVKSSILKDFFAFRF